MYLKRIFSSFPPYMNWTRLQNSVRNLEMLVQYFKGLDAIDAVHGREEVVGVFKIGFVLEERRHLNLTQAQLAEAVDIYLYGGH